jgi:hypothetical protein
MGTGQYQSKSVGACSSSINKLLTKIDSFFFLRTNFGTTPISGQSIVIPKHIIINGVVVAVTLGK